MIAAGGPDAVLSCMERPQAARGNCSHADHLAVHQVHLRSLRSRKHVHLHASVWFHAVDLDSDSLILLVSNEL